MTNYKIEDLIPHRKKMKLIDRIIEVDENQAITSTIIKEDWPLADKTGANPIIMIELIAQTAGILEGVLKFHEKDLGGSGWLVGIKEANFHINRVPINKEIIITASKSYQLENFGIAKGNVKLDDNLIGEAVLQAIQP